VPQIPPGKVKMYAYTSNPPAAGRVEVPEAKRLKSRNLIF